MEGGNGRNVSTFTYVRFPSNYLLLTLRRESLSLTDIRQHPDVGIRAQDIARRLRVLTDTLTELVAAVKVEYEAVQVFIRKTGLASLPDDLLAVIFDYVVNKDENKPWIPIRWRTAVTLSHVCQHFRNVSLSCPRLWTTMNRSAGMIATCVPRAKDVPLTVDITVNPVPTGVATRWCLEPVLAELLKNVSRWGHLGIDIRLNSSQPHQIGESTIQQLRKLDAPLLVELCIQNGVDG